MYVGADFRGDSRFWFQLFRELETCGIDFVPHVVAKNAVERAHDLATQFFLKTDCTHLVIFHNDLIPRTGFGKLWQKHAQRDILYGWTCMAGKPFVPVIYQLEPWAESDKLAARYVYPFLDVIPAQGELRLFGHVSGALIRRNVIETIRTWAYDWDSKTCLSLGGEDLTFNRQVHAHEFDYVLDLQYIVEHFDSDLSVPYALQVDWQDYKQLFQLFTEHAQELIVQRFTGGGK